jgi:hypothetical protein
VVDEPVDHRDGDGVVAEDLAPRAERLVAGDDQAGALVAAADEHEHQVGSLGVERDVADLVADQQRDPSSRRNSSSRRPWRWASARTATHSVAVRKSTRCPARQARVPKAIARWILPVPGGPSRITFSRAWRKSSLAEVLDHLLLHAALEGEVELLQGLVRWEAGGADPQPPAGGLARGQLGGEQRLGEAFIAPALLAGPVGEHGQRARRRQRFHRAEQVRELGAVAEVLAQGNAPHASYQRSDRYQLARRIAGTPRRLAEHRPRRTGAPGDRRNCPGEGFPLVVEASQE